MISTRHIRKDWPEWVDWPQQSTVSTMCGVRSKPHLSGIPGITFQPQVVERAGRKAWGWCGSCIVATWGYLLPPSLTREVTASCILTLHRSAQEQIVWQYRSILLDRLDRADPVRQPKTIEQLVSMIDDINDEFDDVLSNRPVS